MTDYALKCDPVHFKSKVPELGARPPEPNKPPDAAPEPPPPQPELKE